MDVQDASAALRKMAEVLLLNATFEPLSILLPRRAATLLLTDRAESVAARSEPVVLHSARLAIAVPSVMRLRTYVKVPYFANAAPLSRRAVLARDSNRCAYCGGLADTIDHVIPRSRGGLHEWGNVVACCRRHNFEKGDRLLEEIGWTLDAPPSTPRGPLWRWRPGECDPSWEPYLRQRRTAA